MAVVDLLGIGVNCEGALPSSRSSPCPDCSNILTVVAPLGDVQGEIDHADTHEGIRITQVVAQVQSAHQSSQVAVRIRKPRQIGDDLA